MKYPRLKHVNQNYENNNFPNSNVSCEKGPSQKYLKTKPMLLKRSAKENLLKVHWKTKESAKVNHLKVQWKTKESARVNLLEVQWKTKESNKNIMR